MAAATIDDYLAAADSGVAPVAERLRAVVESALPRAASKMYQGIPVWLIADSPSVGIKANSRDVALLLFRGQRISDATQRLRASGSFELASVKFTSIDDIDEPALRDWLRQAEAVEG